MIRIIQLSDCHLLSDTDAQVKGWNTHNLLKQTLVHLEQHHRNTDLLLLTGDLSQDESLQSYLHLQNYLKPLKIPGLALAGNHDHLPTLHSAFTDGPISCDKTISIDGWHIILVNSAQAGETAGYITEQEQQWLQQQLEHQPDAPTLIALHHPVLPIGSRWMDAVGTRNAADFLDIIDQHPQVQLVLFGHIHQEFSATRNGVRYLGTPSSCFQFKPGCDVFALDERPPGYRWLELFPDATFKTGIDRAGNNQPQP